MPLTRSAVSAGAKFPHFRLEGLGVITFYCKLYGLHINFNFPQYYLRPNNTRREKKSSYRQICVRCKLVSIDGGICFFQWYLHLKKKMDIKKPTDTG